MDKYWVASVLERVEEDSCIQLGISSHAMASMYGLHVRKPSSILLEYVVQIILTQYMEATMLLDVGFFQIIIIYYFLYVTFVYSMEYIGSKCESTY